MKYTYMTLIFALLLFLFQDAVFLGHLRPWGSDTVATIGSTRQYVFPWEAKPIIMDMFTFIGLIITTGLVWTIRKYNMIYLLIIIFLAGFFVCNVLGFPDKIQVYTGLMFIITWSIKEEYK